MAISELVLQLTSNAQNEHAELRAKKLKNKPGTGLFVMQFLDAFISQDMQGAKANEVKLSEFHERAELCVKNEARLLTATIDGYDTKKLKNALDIVLKTEIAVSKSTLFTKRLSLPLLMYNFYAHCLELKQKIQEKLRSITVINNPTKADSLNVGNVSFSNYERHGLTDVHEAVQVDFAELDELRAFTGKVMDGDDIHPDRGVCRIYSTIKHQNHAKGVRAYPYTYRVIDFRRRHGFHSTEEDVKKIDYFNQKRKTRKNAVTRQFSNRWRENRTRSFDTYSTRQEGKNYG